MNNLHSQPASQQIENVANFVTSKLLGFDDFVSCDYDSQVQICISFVEGVFRALGTPVAADVHDIITSTAEGVLDMFYNLEY